MKIAHVDLDRDQRTDDRLHHFTAVGETWEKIVYETTWASSTLSPLADTEHVVMMDAAERLNLEEETHEPSDQSVDQPTDG